MATIRWGPPFTLSTPVKSKTRPPPPPAEAVAAAAPLPLHPSAQLQCSRVSTSSSFLSLGNKGGSRAFAFLAVVNEEAVVAEDINTEKNVKEDEDGDSSSEGEYKKQAIPSELYVCNLPRSFEISQLVEMFKPFGHVISAEVSRDSETGISRGCGYVTMGSINSARNAIGALDGIDVGGREMRVRFSVEMNPGRRSPEVMNSAPSKVLIYESPYKIYIGNLAWSTKPEDLRNRFSQFGTVVSARMLYDRKGGSYRAYAFLSFSSAAERDTALSLDGTEFRERVLVVRKGTEKS